MIRPLVFLIAVFVIDQSVKLFVRTHPTWQEGAFFRLTENPGLAFSIPLPPFVLWVVVTLAAVFVIAAGIRFVRERRVYAATCLALLIGGGASNILDRFRFGAVTDVFALPGGLFFNIADVAIFVGIVFFLLPRIWYSSHRKDTAY